MSRGRQHDRAARAVDRSDWKRRGENRARRSGRLCLRRIHRRRHAFRSRLAELDARRQRDRARSRANAANRSSRAAQAPGSAAAPLPIAGGVVLSFARMNRMLEFDARNRRARVQPGLINLDLSRARRVERLFYAPDPSSQKVSTIGGNIATNAGGPHCLSYGTTVNHVLGLEIVDDRRRGLHDEHRRRRIRSHRRVGRQRRNARNRHLRRGCGCSRFPSRCASGSPLSTTSTRLPKRSRRSSPPASCRPRSR